MSSRCEQQRRAVDAALASLLKQQSPKCIPGFGGLPPVQRADTLTRRYKRWRHPLDHMLARDVITYGEYIGGVRFRSDYEAAYVSGDQTSTWRHLLDSVPFVYREKPPRKINQLDTLRRIASRMPDVGYKLLVVICCHGMNLAELSTAVSAERHWLGKEFRLALGVCCDFYNLSIDCRDRDRA